MAEGRLGTEKSWERLFEELDILDSVEEHGSFRICADKIHAYREPRLMTKFDESNDLPLDFKKNGLAILPVSRTEWTIGPYRAYKEFDRGKEPPVSYFEPPADCLLLHEENIRTEDQRLSQLFASGVFSRFLGEEVRYVNPGRFGSGGFSYLIGDTRAKDVLHEVRVQGAQMEIDAALEGPSSITLVEAKNFFPKDFLVRQLYYPFLSYRSGGTLGGKRIRALYITYLSGVYQLWEYEFTDPRRYDSLVLVKTERWHQKEEHPFSMADIQEALALPLRQPITNTFLQANNLDLAMNLLRKIGSEGITGDEAAKAIGYVRRQGNYYLSSLEFLSLIKRDKHRYYLTQDGKSIISMSPSDFWKDLAKRILAVEPIRVLMNGILKDELEEAVKIAFGLISSNFKLNDGTPKRRINSSISWCRRLLREAEGK